MFELSGRSGQDMGGLDFKASRGVVVREFPLEAEFADYMLFVGRQAVGVVEAKKEGTTLSGVATQSEKYLDGLPPHVQRVGTPSAPGTGHPPAAWREREHDEALSREAEGDAP